MKNGQAPVIFGDGEQSRDFTYVENVVNANLLACKADRSACAGEVFNIACGSRVTLNRMIESINKIIGKNMKPTYAEPRLGDVKHSQADIDKAEKRLGYGVKTEFDDGLKKII